MKRSALLLALVIGSGAPLLRSQESPLEPASLTAVPPPAAIPPIPQGPPLEMLKAMRDANLKVLEQQAATLQKLEEMDKLSQTLKLLGKRS